jgi:hypothetical protein
MTSRSESSEVGFRVCPLKGVGFRVYPQAVEISTITGGPPSSAMWASEYEIGGFRVA